MMNELNSGVDCAQRALARPQLTLGQRGVLHVEPTETDTRPKGRRGAVKPRRVTLGQKVTSTLGVVPRIPGSPSQGPKPFDFEGFRRCMLTLLSTEQKLLFPWEWPEGAPGESVVPDWWTRMPYRSADDIIIVHGRPIRSPRAARQRTRHRRQGDINPDDAAWLGSFERLGLDEHQERLCQDADGVDRCDIELPIDCKPRRMITRDGGYEEYKQHEVTGLLGGSDSWEKHDARQEAAQPSVEAPSQRETPPEAVPCPTSGSGVGRGSTGVEPQSEPRCGTCGQVLKPKPQNQRSVVITSKAEARRGYASRKARRTCPECGQPIVGKKGGVKAQQLNGRNGEATNQDDVKIPVVLAYALWTTYAYIFAALCAFLAGTHGEWTRHDDQPRRSPSAREVLYRLVDELSQPKSCLEWLDALMTFVEIFSPGIAILYWFLPWFDIGDKMISAYDIVRGRWGHCPEAAQPYLCISMLACAALAVASIFLSWQRGMRFFVFLTAWSAAWSLHVIITNPTSECTPKIMPALWFFNGLVSLHILLAIPNRKWFCFKKEPARRVPTRVGASDVRRTRSAALGATGVTAVPVRGGSSSFRNWLRGQRRSQERANVMAHGESEPFGPDAHTYGATAPTPTTQATPMEEVDMSGVDPTGYEERKGQEDEYAGSADSSDVGSTQGSESSTRSAYDSESNRTEFPAAGVRARTIPHYERRETWQSNVGVHLSDAFREIVSPIPNVADIMFAPYEESDTGVEYAPNTNDLTTTVSNCTVALVTVRTATGACLSGHIAIFPSCIVTQRHVVVDPDTDVVYGLIISGRKYRPSFVLETMDQVVFGRMPDYFVPRSGERLFAVSTIGVALGTQKEGGVRAFFQTRPAWSGSPIFHAATGRLVGYYGDTHIDENGQRATINTSLASVIVHNQYKPGMVYERVQPMGSGKSTKTVREITTAFGKVLLLNPNVATVFSLYEWHASKGDFQVRAVAGHKEKREVRGASLGAADIVIMTYESADLMVMRDHKFLQRFGAVVIDEAHEPSSWSRLFVEHMVLPKSMSHMVVIRLTATPKTVGFSLPKTNEPVEYVDVRDTDPRRLPKPEHHRLHFVHSRSEAVAVARIYEKDLGIQAMPCTSANKAEAVEWFNTTEGVKVLVATNTVRSGITLDVTELVDPGLEMRVGIELTGVMTRLLDKTEPWSSIQRMGRNGRTPRHDGRRYRTWYNGANCGRSTVSVADWEVNLRADCLRLALHDQFGMEEKYLAPDKHELMPTISGLVQIHVPCVEAYKTTVRANECWRVYQHPSFIPVDVDPLKLILDGDWLVPTQNSKYVGDYRNYQSLKLRDEAAPTHYRNHADVRNVYAGASLTSLFLWYLGGRYFKGFTRSAVIVHAERALDVVDDCREKFDADQTIGYAPYTHANEKAQRIIGSAKSFSNAMNAFWVFALGTPVMGFVLASFVSAFVSPTATVLMALWTLFLGPSQITFNVGEGEVAEFAGRYGAVLIGLGMMSSLVLSYKWGRQNPSLTRVEHAVMRVLLVSFAIVCVVVGIVVAFGAGVLPKELHGLAKALIFLFHDSRNSLLEALLKSAESSSRLTETSLHLVRKSLDHTPGRAEWEEFSLALEFFSSSQYKVYLFVFNTFALSRWLIQLALATITSMVLGHEALYGIMRREARHKALLRGSELPVKQPRSMTNAWGLTGWLLGTAVNVGYSLVHYGRAMEDAYLHFLTQLRRDGVQVGALLDQVGLNDEIPQLDVKPLARIANFLRFLVAPPAAFISNLIVKENGLSPQHHAMIFAAMQVSWDQQILVTMLLVLVAATGKLHESGFLNYVTGMVAFSTVDFSSFRSAYEWIGSCMVNYDLTVTRPQCIDVLKSRPSYVYNQVTMVSVGRGRTRFEHETTPATPAAWAEVYEWTRKIASGGWVGNQDIPYHYVRDFPPPSATPRISYGFSTETEWTVFELNDETQQFVGKFAEVGIIRPLSSRNTWFVVGRGYDKHRRGGFPTKVLKSMAFVEPTDMRATYDFYYNKRLTPMADMETAPVDDPGVVTTIRRMLAKKTLEWASEQIHDPALRVTLHRVVARWEASLKRTAEFMAEIRRRYGRMILSTYRQETETTKVIGRVRPPVPNRPRRTRYNRKLAEVMRQYPEWGARWFAARARLDHDSFFAGFLRRFVRPSVFKRWPKELRRSLDWHLAQLHPCELAQPPYDNYNHRTGPGLLEARTFPGRAIDWANNPDFWVAGITPYAGRESFPKNETRVKSKVDWSALVPRAIVMLTGSRRYMTHALNPLMHQIYALPTSAIGKTPFDVAQWIGERADRGLCFMSNDVVKWDASQNICTRLLAWHCYLHMNASQFVADYCLDGLWAPVLHQNGFITMAQAPTNSGDADTSGGNTLINSIVMRSAMEEAGIVVDCQIVGDDNIIAGTRAQLEALRPYIRRAYEGVGFELDENSLIIEDDPRRVRFCSHGAVKCGTKWWPMRDCGEILAKLSVTKGDDDASLRNMAAGYYLLYGASPHVRRLCEWALGSRRAAVLPADVVKRLSGFTRFEDEPLNAKVPLVEVLRNWLIERGGDLPEMTPEDQRFFGFNSEWKF